VSTSSAGTKTMASVRTVRALRDALASVRHRGSIGLVPTMGALHEGHLSLIRSARSQCATVVVSVFTNPAQFGPDEDLSDYPRDEARDLVLCEAEGVDLAFLPDVSEIYPSSFDTIVEVGKLTTVLCGHPSRRGSEHFRGVTTVVAKLFNIVGPDVAFFGQKDAQQAIVIKKMARDLDMPVRIEVLPTVRDTDGLAISSRNAYLSPSQRQKALALNRCLQAATDAVAHGATEASQILNEARKQLGSAGVEPEYLELRSAEDLSAVDRLTTDALLCVAARIGKARLIDNVILQRL
jgi:pantoate--beta-alanine ligase